MLGGDGGRTGVARLVIDQDPSLLDRWQLSVTTTGSAKLISSESVDLPDSSRFFRRAAVSSARARAHSSDIGEILGLQSCLKAPAIPIHEMFHPRDVAEQHSRLSGWGGSRGDRARPSPVPPVAPCDRPPRFDGLHAARLVSGLWSSPSLQLRPTRRLPEPYRGPVATVPSSTLHYRCGGSAGIHRLPNSPARRGRAGTFSHRILLDLLAADQRYG